MNSGLSERLKLPSTLIIIVLVLSVLPGILHYLGVDFGSEFTFEPNDLENQKNNLSGVLHGALSGSFIHFLLEWSSLAIATFVAVLGLVYFRFGNSGDSVVAIALFWAGCMDGFHALAATYLVQGAGDPTNFIPFTWAIGRLFTAAILVAGVLLVTSKLGKKALAGKNQLLTIAAIFGVLAIVVIEVCSNVEQLPQTMFPSSVITRPWDFVPLLLFIWCGVHLFQRFHREYDSPLSGALWLSAVPAILTQLHMTFGSVTMVKKP